MRWYVTSLDNSNPPYTTYAGTNPESAANDILLAVSKDSNPADGWTFFVIPADEVLFGINEQTNPSDIDPLNINPTTGVHRPFRADDDTIGFNAELNSTALVITANLYDDGSGGDSNDPVSDATAGQLASTLLLSIPKSDLLSASQTNDPNVMDHLTSLSEGAWEYGINPQGVVSYDSNTTSLVLAQAADQTTGALDASAFELTTILQSGTDFGVSGTPISIPLPVTAPAPIPAPQPDNGPDIGLTTETALGATKMAPSRGTAPCKTTPSIPGW